MAPESPGKLAGRLDLDAGRVARMLDEMADKGLIYSSTRDGEKWYKLIQLVPGIFELQFMKGEVTERAKELARLFDAYFHASVPQKEAKSPFADEAAIHMARVIPIEQTMTATMNVFPFEVASKYIADNSPITVSICYCRHEKRLLDRGCKYPDEVCLQLGPFRRICQGTRVWPRDQQSGSPGDFEKECRGRSDPYIQQHAGTH